MPPPERQHAEANQGEGRTAGLRNGPRIVEIESLGVTRERDVEATRAIIPMGHPRGIVPRVGEFTQIEAEIAAVVSRDSACRRGDGHGVIVLR